MTPLVRTDLRISLLETLGPRQVKWPGHGVSADRTCQWVSGQVSGGTVHALSIISGISTGNTGNNARYGQSAV